MQSSTIKTNGSPNTCSPVLKLSLCFGRLRSAFFGSPVNLIPIDHYSYSIVATCGCPADSSQKQKRKGEKTKGLFPYTPETDAAVAVARTTAAERNANDPWITALGTAEQHARPTISRSLWIRAFSLAIIRLSIPVCCPLLDHVEARTPRANCSKRKWTSAE